MGNRGVAISPSQVVQGPSLARACRARPSRVRPSRARPSRAWPSRARPEIGPFHGRVGGVALKPEPSCARPKPGGSKSCEARNWACSLGGEEAWHGLWAWHVKKRNCQK